MKLEEISHPWPPNIHRYEQTFFGIPVNAFMVAGVLGIMSFVVVSQGLAGFVGLLVGALLGSIVFGLVVLITTPFASFHHLVLPQYLLQRLHAARHQTLLQLPLIVSSDNQSAVELLDWAGQQQGVLE